VAKLETRIRTKMSCILASPIHSFCFEAYVYSYWIYDRISWPPVARLTTVCSCLSSESHGICS